MRGGWDGKMEVCARAGEFPPDFQIYLLGGTNRWTTKKSCQGVLRVEGQREKSKNLLREQVLTGMWAKREDPLARKDACAVPQLFLESTAPFLVWHLTWERG